MGFKEREDPLHESRLHYSLSQDFIPLVWILYKPLASRGKDRIILTMLIVQEAKNLSRPAVIPTLAFNFSKSGGNLSIRMSPLRNRQHSVHHFVENIGLRNVF